MKKLEQILQENKDRFVLFPISQKDIWKLYKQIESNFWFADNISFKQDLDDFNNKLTETEREFVRFAISNLILRYNNDQNLMLTRFTQEMQYPEARCFLGFQIMMTGIHSETYSVFAEIFIGKHEEIAQRLTVFINSDVYPEKIKWIKNRLVNEPDFPKRLLAYTAEQRIFCSSLFPVISSFKEREIMNVFTMLTTFMYNDEGLFTDFALSVYSQLDNPLSPEEENKIITEAVEIEQQLIKEHASIYSAAGANLEQLNRYVHHIADSIAQSLSGQSIYGNQANPYKEVVWQRSFVKIDPARQKPDKPADKTFSLDTDF